MLDCSNLELVCICLFEQTKNKNPTMIKEMKLAICEVQPKGIVNFIEYSQNFFKYSSPTPFTLHPYIKYFTLAPYTHTPQLTSPIFFLILKIFNEIFHTRIMHPTPQPRLPTTTKMSNVIYIYFAQFASLTPTLYITNFCKENLKIFYEIFHTCMLHPAL